MNSTKKLSFNDFFTEFFSGLFAYDSRFQRTLRVLLFKPGKISKDYINGKRMRYANPFRFYLSASILFFLLFGLTVDFGEDLIQGDRSNRGAMIHRPPQVGLDSINKIITSRGLDSIKIDTTQRSYKDKYISQAEIDTMNFFDASNKKIDLYSSFVVETGIRNSETAIDSLQHEHSRYNHWLYKKMVDVDTFKEDPGLFINYFISKLPFIIFFYLPVFALFIWLLYLRRNFNYMEHLIFAFHTQTMFFFLYGFALLLEEFIAGNWAFTGANFIFLFYLYKGMRNFYGQGRVKTILKFILLNLIFFILAIIAAIISLLASFSIY
ncbi:DUF3667 domain-containing protein [Christiangramia crocea]|uniref:DUF3667 domain-containing protein n=1 Tax=Christiangramia crocea TaxID=2904124 RepID=A0A9X1UTU9_9FLAO|nr:DUF3667 domain-containing protein [Gramella crocea]MCG9970041.1 DUF3667 domain-containing protein [Gramella crocea]